MAPLENFVTWKLQKIIEILLMTLHESKRKIFLSIQYLQI